MYIISPHNNQKLIYSDDLSPEDELYEEARKELTITTKYHDWSNSTARKIIDAISDDDYLSSELIDTYNGYIRAYNQYGDLQPIAEEMTEEEIQILINENSYSI